MFSTFVLENSETPWINMMGAMKATVDFEVNLRPLVAPNWKQNWGFIRLVRILNVTFLICHYFNGMFFYTLIKVIPLIVICIIDTMWNTTHNQSPHGILKSQGNAWCYYSILTTCCFQTCESALLGLGLHPKAIDWDGHWLGELHWLT